MDALNAHKSEKKFNIIRLQLTEIVVHRLTSNKKELLFGVNITILKTNCSNKTLLQHTRENKKEQVI